MFSIKILTLFLLLSPFAEDIFSQEYKCPIKFFSGAGGVFFNNSNSGWFMEAGLKAEKNYYCIEYGNYGSIFNPNSIEVGQTMMGVDRPLLTNDPTIYKISRIHYLGLSSGIIISPFLWIGATALISEQSNIYSHIEPGTSIEKWDSMYKFWIDMGLDLHSQLLGNFLFDLAYSYRRGLKTGIGYLF